MNRRFTVSLLLGVVILSVLLVVAVPIVRSGSNSSADDDSNFVPFIPIWFAAIVPILIKRQEDNQATEKAKRKLKNSDRFQMMSDLVNHLDNEELGYLHQRLIKRLQR